MNEKVIELKMKEFTKEMFYKDNVSLLETKSYNIYVKLFEAHTFPIEGFNYGDVKFYKDFRNIVKGDVKIGFYVNGKNITTYSADDLVNKKEIKEKLISKLNKKYNKFNIKFVE